MFNKIKDWGSSQAAAAFLRGKIEPYGELRTLEIDSAAKKIRVVLHLKGEAEAIDFRVHRYQISVEDQKHSVVISEFECSREWLHLVAADHILGRKFKIPRVVAKLL